MPFDPAVRPPGLAEPVDDADPDPAELLARGVARLLTGLGYASLTEFTLRSGRRADVAGLDRKGRLLIVEIKRSRADFRADAKWPDYLDYCDQFYFAVPRGFPLEVLPDDTGLMLADRYGAEILRPAAVAQTALHASRRREIINRFARSAAARLTQLQDPQPETPAAGHRRGLNL